MGQGRRSAQRGTRGVLFALAFLALVLKVLAPPGFMVADQPSGASFPIVICTAQGPLHLDPSHGDAPSHKPAADAPCAFAGNAVGAPPPSDAPLAVAALAAYQDYRPQTVADLAPGRGLAAPPPPSQAPPTLL